MSEKPPHVSGFVSILGRPNAGKSTLLNALTGAKLAIVSSRPQTTRAAVQGVVTTPEYQIVFMDTPGIHRSSSLFNKRMMDQVRAALEGRDLLVYVADAALPFGAEDAQALDMLKKSGTPAILALNKIDRFKDKGKLLPLIGQYQAAMEFAEYIPISALTGEGLDELRRAIVSRLPEGPEYFPPGQITDQPERFLAAEFVREKILEETRQEVPYAVAVVVDRWEETPRLVKIAATVYVEREGQKAIVIGAGGAMLKRVGTLARQDIERLLGRKVFLQLFVKVRPDWRQSPEFLNEIDWRSMAGER